jgi:hypothetical protein
VVNFVLLLAAKKALLFYRAYSASRYKDIKKIRK